MQLIWILIQEFSDKIVIVIIDIGLESDLSPGSFQDKKNCICTIQCITCQIKKEGVNMNFIYGYELYNVHRSS